MKNKILFVFLVASFFIPNLVRADAPPPPPFTAHFTYEGQKLTDKDFYSVSLACIDPKNNYTLKSDIVPQLNINQPDESGKCSWIPVAKGYCHADSSCYFDDFLTGQFKLAVYIPSLNKTFVSGVIKRAYLGHYGSETPREYYVDLSKDNSVKVNGALMVDYVINSSSAPSNFLGLLILAVIVTILLEAIALWIFVRIEKAPKSIFWGLLVGNLISVPLVWLTNYDNPFTFFLFFTEILAVIFEAWMYRLFTKKQLSWKTALLISLVANVVSFIIGPFLMYLSW